MRIHYVAITNFKNLRNFAVTFDEASPATVLVGRNGTGKSNLLEALIVIFRDLDLGAQPAFKYKIAYTCNAHIVHIDADPARPKDQVIITADGKSIPYSQFTRQRHPDMLPNYVFGYYSGPSNRMESHFEKHQEQFYRSLLSGVDQPLRPLFYARLVHSQFVLLAFFVEHSPTVMQFLDDELGILDLDSVLFIMRQPSWTRDTSEGDPRFWYARGTVQAFLSKLYELSLGPLRLKQRVSVGFRKSSTLEHLYLYLPDTEALRALANSYRNIQEFFKALESTYISELISEVRIRVKSRNVDGSLTFRELSEGEQQLLMVLGLLRFTKEEESLFLLDEPDTHLNPAWSIQYLQFLRNIVGEQQTSHIIMATHDPLVIAGLTRSHVCVMRSDETTGRIWAEHPEDDPRGMGVAALLTSDVYGLRSQLDLDTLQLLDRQQELVTKSELSEAEQRNLEEINEELGNRGFTREFRDPMLSLFFREMAELEKEHGLQQPTLTKEQQLKRRELARHLLIKLRSESNDAS